MNRYVILSNTTLIADGLKLYYRPRTFRPSIPDPRVRQTLNGKRNLSFAPPLRRWSLQALAQYQLGAEWTGYMTADQLLYTYFGATTAAGRKLLFQDPFGTVYKAFLIKCVPAPALPGTLDGTSGWYEFEIELVERDV